MYGAAVLLCAALLVSIADRAVAATPARELTDLTLEELGNVIVTSVSRREERLSDAPASIYVITSDDIRRSGVTTLPAALRLAPNLQVARIDAARYAITARGFNNSIGNKLLVLIDGRTVYTPLFSGVFWEQQNVMLEDVERIEVISGPGATLWGANAVNGVINIITRAARDTQEALVAVGGGNREQGAAFRYGGRIGSEGHFRVYGTIVDLQNTKRADGNAVRDGWETGQVGFRADWSDSRDAFTVQGDAYRGKSEHRGFARAIEIPATRVSGFNLLARWTRQLSSDSDFRIQAYLDRTDRDERVLFRPDAEIFDIEMQYGISRASHQILMGGGYRHARDHVQPGLLGTAFIPSRSRLNWANLFVEDEITLTEQVKFTAGIKLESNDYTGVEYLPSARLAWKPSVNSLAWGAVSRAVRAPSRLDRDVFLPPTPPFVVRGGPNFESEVAKVFEVGYRAQPSNDFTYSITAFYHIWDKLRSGELAPGGGIFLENEIEGTVTGIEAWASFQATREWRLSGGLTTLNMNLRLKPDSTDPVGADNPNLANDPKYQWLLRSTLDITPRHDFDLIVRRVGALPHPHVPSYTTVDAHFTWRPTRQFELSVTAQNLFGPRHAEFGALPSRSEFERGVFLKLVWQQ